VIKYNCAFPGCYTVVDTPRSYCKRHEAYGEQQKAHRLADAPRQRWAGAERPNEALYHTPEWRRLRAEVLRSSPRCARCNGTEQLQVHHIVPPKGDRAQFYDASNLIVLCKVCHDMVTSAENRTRHGNYY